MHFWEKGFQAGVKCQSPEAAMCLGAIVAGTEWPEWAVAAA